MLTIPFSHRFYAKWFDLGGIPLDMPTKLLDYKIAHKLGDDFREQDTKFWRGGYGIQARAERFDLGPGPYLILYLATDTGNKLISSNEESPGWIEWTTVRRPWKRTKRTCDACKWEGPGCPGCVDLDHWLPSEAPKKYQQARGQLVRIVYRPEEAE